MTTNLVATNQPQIEDDDGFGGSLTSGRLIKGTLSKWTDNTGWVDRDGVALASPLLVVAINEVLQRLQDGKPTIISDKPLPDIDELNENIPGSEWELGIDKKPRPPWARLRVVYFVNLATGGFYTYAASTYGAHLAFE